MRKRLAVLAISTGLLFGVADNADAATRRRRHYRTSHSTAHRRHVNTARRVGVGAAGGAAIGALAGGGKGAGIGAVAGAGAGALYDSHKKSRGN
jgi:hypothetical protein